MFSKTQQAIIRDKQRHLQLIQPHCIPSLRSLQILPRLHSACSFKLYTAFSDIWWPTLVLHDVIEEQLTKDWQGQHMGTRLLLIRLHLCSFDCCPINLSIAQDDPTAMPQSRPSCSKPTNMTTLRSTPSWTTRRMILFSCWIVTRQFQCFTFNTLTDSLLGELETIGRKFIKRFLNAVWVDGHLVILMIYWLIY